MEHDLCNCYMAKLTDASLRTNYIHEIKSTRIAKEKLLYMLSLNKYIQNPLMYVDNGVFNLILLHSNRSVSMSC